MEPKVMSLLLYMVEHAGTIVSREQLFEAVWPGVIVTDDTLTQAIIKLRKALGDNARNPRYIKTVPKRGYLLSVEASQIPSWPGGRFRRRNVIRRTGSSPPSSPPGTGWS
ncbi:MAG: transcriptional regulator [Sedimenticola sp.]|nr:transcriptional regulator [Sedimenticola sp.]